MDIITILQLIQPYLTEILATIFVVSAYGMWKGFRFYKEQQAKKYNIAHMRKMAGIATDSDRAQLKKKPPRMGKRRAKFDWKEFIKKLDIRDDVKQMNPFRVIRELARLKKELDYVDNANKKFRWSIDGKIDERIAKSKEPKLKIQDFVKPVLTRKEIGDRQISSLLPRKTTSCFE